MTDLTAKEAVSLGDAARAALDADQLRGLDEAAAIVLESAEFDYATVQGWVETIGLEVLRKHDRPDVLVEQAPGGGVRLVYDKPLGAELAAAIDRIVPEGRLHHEHEAGMAPVVAGHSNRWTWNSWFAHAEAGLQVAVGNGFCTTSWHVANGFGPFLMTAGHCGTTGTQVRAPDGASVFSDQIRNRFDDSNTDSAVFSTANIYTLSRVHRQNSSHVEVTFRFSAPHPSVGYCSNMWVSGIPAGTVGGDWSGCISHANAFVGGVRYWCYDFAVDPFQGMSGGPFYRIKSDGSSGERIRVGTWPWHPASRQHGVTGRGIATVDPS